LNCRQARDLMSAYLDAALAPSLRQDFEEHLQECPACTAELGSLAAVVSLVRSLPDEPVPEGFHQSVMAAVAAVHPESRVVKMPLWARFDFRRLGRVSWAAAALVIFFGLGLAAGRYLFPAVTGSTAYAPPAVTAKPASYDATIATGDSTVTDTVAGIGRQVAYSAKMDLQVQDVRVAAAAVSNLAEQNGGYVEESRITTGWFGRVSAHVKLRVPQAKFQATVDQVGAQGKVISKEISAQDVTASYVDVTSKLIALQTQEQQLLDLLRQATSVDDIVKIQKELEDVRAQIEAIKAAIQNYDNLVAYSAVEVNISRPLFPWLSAVWPGLGGP